MTLPSVPPDLSALPPEPAELAKLLNAMESAHHAYMRLRRGLNDSDPPEVTPGTRDAYLDARAAVWAEVQRMLGSRFTENDAVFVEQMAVDLNRVLLAHEDTPAKAADLVARIRAVAKPPTAQTLAPP